MWADEQMDGWADRQDKTRGPRAFYRSSDNQHKQFSQKL